MRLQALTHSGASKNPGPVGVLGVRGTLLLLLFRVGALEHPGREIRLVSIAPRNGEGKWGGVCTGISIGFGQTGVNLFHFEGSAASPRSCSRTRRRWSAAR